MYILKQVNNDTTVQIEPRILFWQEMPKYTLLPGTETRSFEAKNTM